MSVLALDFDGVICSSLREVLLVAVRTWAEREPTEPLPEPLGELAEDREIDWPRIEASEGFATFRGLLPLGNRAEDFGVALRSIAEGWRIDDQATYDAAFHRQDAAWLEAFHREFYRQRSRMRETDLASWLALHRAYEPFLDLLRRHRGGVSLAIATAKDRRSVELLLESFGALDMFGPGSVLDKDTGVDKSAHMRVLIRRLDVEPGDVTFVDDKVNHLERVATVGVRPVLAAWGFNGSRERRRARELGFSVATLDTAENTLFGGGGGTVEAMP